MTGGRSAAERLRATIMRDRDRITRDERPTYHVTWSPRRSALDVRVTELPLVRLFVPDELGIDDGARFLIACTLDVDPAAFDVLIRPATKPGPLRRSRSG